MGARETKSKITNRNVYVKYNPTLVDYIDLKFNQPFKTLLRIEILRCKFILVWNELLRNTGAITLRDAKFYYILESLMLNLGLLINGRLNSIKLSTEDPYVGFEPNVNISPDMLRLIESYRKLLIFSREHEKQIIDANDDINLNVIYVEDLIRDPDDMLKRQNVPPIKSFSIKAKMRQNLLRLKHGQLVISTIKNVLEDIKRSLPDFIYKFYYGEEMRKIEIMIEDARRKHIAIPAKLIYKYINQPKLISFDDHHDAIDKDIKSEREAQDILAAYYRENDLNKVIVYPSKTEPVITNVVPTIIQEEAPNTNQYRSITEPRDITLQREIYSRTIEPRSSLERERTLDYNRNIVESRQEMLRDKPLEYNRTVTEPRQEILREKNIDYNRNIMEPRQDILREGAFDYNRTITEPRYEPKQNIKTELEEIGRRIIHPRSSGLRNQEREYREMTFAASNELPNRESELRFGEGERDVVAAREIRERELRERELENIRERELEERERLREGNMIPKITSNEISRPRREIRQENVPTITAVREKDYREVPITNITSDVVNRPDTERPITEELRFSNKNYTLPIRENQQFREIPATVKRSTTSGLIEERREQNIPIRETKDEYIKPSIENRISDIGRNREPISETYNKPITERISDIKRERELARDEYERQTAEQRTFDIRKEIAEIERRINEPKLNEEMEIRREREMIAGQPFNRNTVSTGIYEPQRYSRDVGGGDFVKTATTEPRTLVSDTSDIRRESEYDNPKLGNEKEGRIETPSYKKKKYKKHKKHKYENKENIDLNKPDDIILKTSKVIIDDKNGLPSSNLPQKEPFKSANIKDIRGFSSRPPVTTSREEYKMEDKLNK